MTFSIPARVKYELYCPVATNSNIIQIKNIGIREFFEAMNCKYNTISQQVCYYC